jgi:hypothetical protein
MKRRNCEEKFEITRKKEVSWEQIERKEGYELGLGVRTTTIRKEGGQTEKTLKNV